MQGKLYYKISIWKVRDTDRFWQRILYKHRYTVLLLLLLRTNYTCSVFSQVLISFLLKTDINRPAIIYSFKKKICSILIEELCKVSASFIKLYVLKKLQNHFFTFFEDLKYGPLGKTKKNSGWTIYWICSAKDYISPPPLPATKPILPFLRHLYSLQRYAV